MATTRQTRRNTDDCDPAGGVAYFDARPPAIDPSAQNRRSRRWRIATSVRGSFPLDGRCRGDAGCTGRWKDDGASTSPRRHSLLRALGRSPLSNLGPHAVISAAKYVILSASLMEARPSEVDDVFRTRELDETSVSRSVADERLTLCAGGARTFSSGTSAADSAASSLTLAGNRPSNFVEVQNFCSVRFHRRQTRSIDQKTPGQARTHPATTERTETLTQRVDHARDQPRVPLRDSVIDHDQAFQTDDGDSDGSRLGGR